MLRIAPVTNKQELNKFITYPNKLYPTSIFKSDEALVFDQSKNNSFANFEWLMYLVYNEKRIVGRFALIINNIYNNENNVKELRFTRFDCINDQEVSKFIFDYMVNYAKEHEFTSIIGPLGFTSYDRNGLLVNNFDIETAYLNNYNLEYYNDLLVNYGFNPYSELKSYSLELDSNIKSNTDKICKYILEKYNLKYQFPTSSKEGGELFQKSFTLLNKINQTYETDTFYQRIDDKMAKFYTTLLTRFIRENDVLKYFVSILDENNNMVGFCAVSSDVMNYSKKSGGNTDLITYARLTKATEVVDLVSMFVDREYQNCDLESVMLYYLITKLNENGVKKICTRAILETSFNRFMARDYEFKEDHEYKIYHYVLK